MKRLLYIVSAIALLLVIIPPVLFFNGKIGHEQQNWYMLAGTIIWFASAYFWLGRKAKS